MKLRTPGWKAALLAAAFAGFTTRLVHFVLYLSGPLSNIYYQPVLGAYRFETSALELLSGVAQDAPYLYASPIYTYLILPFYALGAGRLPLLVVQALAGASIPVLIVLLARRLGSGPLQSILAALLWAVYAPPIFLELTVLPATIAALTTILVLLLTVSGRTSSVLLILAGAGCGVLAGIRAPLAAVVIPLVTTHLLRSRSGIVIRIATAAGAIAAMLLVLLPMALYQKEHFAGFTPFPSCGGFNLVLGHSDDASGYGPPAPSVGLVESATEDIGQVAMRLAFDRGGVRDFAGADSYWTEMGFRLILDHPEQEVELTLRKLGGFFGLVPFDVYYDLSRLDRFNPALKLFALPRWVLIGFFAACLIPFLRYGRNRTAAVVPVAAAIGTSVLFFHCERFVMPALPVMAAIAASGLTAVTAERGHAAGRLLMILAGLTLLAPGFIRPAPVIPEGIYLQSLAVRAYNSGDPMLALTFYERAAIVAPEGSVTWRDSHLAAASLAESIGDYERARVHRACLEEQGPGQAGGLR